MFYKIFGNINEVLIGTIGVAFIGSSAWYSIKEKELDL